MTADLLVVLRRTVDSADARRLAQLLGMQIDQDFQQLGIQRWSTKAHRDRPDDWRQVVEQLRASPLVRSVELDRPLGLDDVSFALPNDPLLINQGAWGMEDENIQWSLINNGIDEGKFTENILFDADIDAPEAWQFVEALPREPKETIVAVFDSGIDWAHPDLEANMWTNPGEIAGNRIDDDKNGYVDDIHGYDFVHRDPDPMDSDPEASGHGTHVAGIIGASQNNGKGIAGINPYARLMAIKIFPSADGMFMSNVIEALEYSVKMGATVSNHSWAWTGSKKSANALQQAFERAIKSGMFITTANGNETVNIDYQGTWPAAIKLPGKITVASTDSQDQLSGFSNYGLNVAGVAAPGSNIYSTLPRASIEGPYGYLSGTSMAGPMVAGVASLIKSMDPGLKPAQIGSRILAGADQIDALAKAVTSSGRLNAFKSLHASAKDKINELSLSPQWKYGSQMRIYSDSAAGYGDEIWAQAGNQNNYDCMPMLLFDLPRLLKPIRAAELQIQVTNFWTPATQERLEIRVNPAITPTEAIEYAQSYEDGASTHRELLQGSVLGSVVLDQASQSGDQDTPLTIPIDAAGIKLLNAWASEQNGRNLVLTVGIGGSRPVDPVTGELLYGGIAFSRSDSEMPSLDLNFRKGAKTLPGEPVDGSNNADTTAPGALVLTLAADTGSSSTDRITSNGRVEVSGLEAGATWRYSVDAGRTWIAGVDSAFTLGEGNYFTGEVVARQIDAAGNIGALSAVFPKFTVLAEDLEQWLPVAG